MGNLVFGSAERPGNSADAAEIPVVRDNDVVIGQGARPTERPEKASAAARHSMMKLESDKHMWCVLCEKVVKRSVHIFIPYERAFSLVF